MDNELDKLEAESLEEYLWRLGTMKKTGQIDITWDEIRDLCNDAFNCKYTESYYRKKFKRLVAAFQPPAASALFDTELNTSAKNSIREIEKQKILLRDERNQYRKTVREDARRDSFYGELAAAIKAYDKPLPLPAVKDPASDKALYIMLSDLHYGLRFDNIFNKYNEEIAAQRLMNYAHEIIRIGRETKIRCLFLTIMGDLISGNIHPLIKVENQSDVVQQVMGVSELIAGFIKDLADHFDVVNINDVSGNHSRLEPNSNDAARGERLDLLVSWYCKQKLINYNNIFFYDTEEKTMATFNIFGKRYVAVHGDFDRDLKVSAQKLSEVLDEKIDYMLAGHKHVPNLTFGNTTVITNGAIVSGGDEYTVKKRLFGPAYQLVLKISSNGVDAVYPVKLS